MNIIWGGAAAPLLNEAIAAFVGSRMNARFDNFTTMGLVDGETVVAGVVYHNYYPEGGVIELSSASDDKRWLARPVVKAMFGYPFDQLGCQMVILRVSERNIGMVRIAERFGFTAYRIPRLRGRDEAEIIFTLTEETWRTHRVQRGR